MEHLRFHTLPDNRAISNQPTSTADSPSDEPMAEADEPPDERMFGAATSLELAHHDIEMHQQEEALKFKKMPYPIARKESLLTQTINSEEESEEEDDDDDEPLFSGSNRAHSSASTWSRGSRASTADLTSDGHVSPIRSGSPSPALRSQAKFEPPVFNHESFKAPSSIVPANATIKIAESIDPLKKSASAGAAPKSNSNEDEVEKGLGRKRCIMFACGGKGKTAPKKMEEVKAKAEVTEPKKENAPAPAQRKCMLKFVCPSRTATTTPATTTTGAEVKKPTIRLMSPPPPARRIPASPRTVSPKVSRSHRSSDSTARADSPKSVRKVPSGLRRRPSNLAEVPVSEATRFHEFASSDEERDDWTQEASVYRQRLTVQDTLKIENDLRHVCEEADEEAMEEEEIDEEMEGIEDVDEDIDEDEDGPDVDGRSIVDSTGYVTDEGFHTDDEEGFANSDDDESDADSDYAWWAPGGAASGEHLEHIRPSTRRSESGSSIGSFSSTRVFPSKTPKALKRSKTNPIEMRPRTPELPDSTDFVCGTLDEDRPLEEAWLSCRNQRRAANHRPCPQDIDPTFPASDPEMDEEDEEGYEDAIHMDDSDAHFFPGAQHERMSDIDESLPRVGRSVVPRKRSPAGSPRRLRSPPPTKKKTLRSPPPPAATRKVLRSPPPPTTRKVLRSPPPPTTRKIVHQHQHHSPPPAAVGAGRLFGHSPRRMHSPPPRRPLRSPPPSRRTSFTQTPSAFDTHATPIALAQRPRFSHQHSSLPRNGPSVLHARHEYFNTANSTATSDAEGDETQTDALPTRGAIDIVKGLEKKRQRRKEKLYEKACRMRNKRGHGHKEDRDVVLPGMGAQKMRKMGEGLCKARGGAAKRPECVFSDDAGEGSAGTLRGAHILSY